MRTTQFDKNTTLPPIHTLGLIDGRRNSAFVQSHTKHLLASDSIRGQIARSHLAFFVPPFTWIGLLFPSPFVAHLLPLLHLLLLYFQTFDFHGFLERTRAPNSWTSSSPVCFIATAYIQTDHTFVFVLDLRHSDPHINFLPSVLSYSFTPLSFILPPFLFLHPKPSTRPPFLSVSSEFTKFLSSQHWDLATKCQRNRQRCVLADFSRAEAFMFPIIFSCWYDWVESLDYGIVIS